MTSDDLDRPLPQMHFVVVRQTLPKIVQALSCGFDRDAAWAAAEKVPDHTVVAYGAAYCPICTDNAPLMSMAATRPTEPKQAPVEPQPKPPEVKVVTW